MAACQVTGLLDILMGSLDDSLTDMAKFSNSVTPQLMTLNLARYGAFAALCNGVPLL